ncbi:MAG: response regulator [Lachnospiraceae bacterium]|nr:response regulator [Lachnospiraceae bacterium]
MIYKILLSGKNSVVIDEFYNHMDKGYDLLSSSTIFRDMVKNLELFKPDLFVYCLHNETPDDYAKMNEFRRHIEKAGCGFAIIGSKEECDIFQNKTNFLADLILAKPLTYDVIRGNIYAYMLDRDRQRELENTKPEGGAPAAAGGAPAAPAPDPARRKHVLVIDDDPLMLKLIKEYLHDKYDVATAVNGKIAYKFLESKTTDMVLLDYEMPGESGPEVFMNLRTRRELDNIPIVFLTGVSDAERVKEVLSLGPQGYLLKPIDKEKLLNKVNGVLDK